jgi:predicted dehydrogenase
MLKIGILGAADTAYDAIVAPVALRDDATIVAIGTRKLATARAYAEAHGIERYFEGYQNVIDQPDIDLIYIPLPPAFHLDMSTKALKAGKNVLLEKPFTMNTREAELLCATATQTGKRVIEAYHYRYHPIFDHLLSLKDEGAFGEIIALEAVFDVPIPADDSAWRQHPEPGGGAIMDMGCYPIHWFRSFLAEEPQTISATGIKNAFGADIALSAELMFSNDVRATFSTDMRSNVTERADFKIHSSRGELTVENLVAPHAGHTIHSTLDNVTRRYTLAGQTTYDYQLDAVIDGLNSATPLKTEGADSIENMRTITRIYEAAGFNRTF